MVREMGETFTIVLIGYLVICCANQVRSYESDRRYSRNNTIPMYANKVGPYFSPSETYAYNNYPFCYSEQVQKKKQSLGEALNGDHLVPSPYKVEFLVDKKFEVACSRKLSRKDVSQLRLAIAQDYYIQMYLDDLPTHILIGRPKSDYTGYPKDNKYLLYTHIGFEIFYNNDHVIEINVLQSTSFMMDLAEDMEVEVEFLYDVFWMETNISFSKRRDVYRKYGLSRHENPWLSIMDICFPILISLGFLLKLYIGQIRKDFNNLKVCGHWESRNNRAETGWKSLHGDVFSHPVHKSLFAAVVGSGTQLVVLMLIILILGVMGLFHPYSRGSLIATIVVGYTLTSGIAGYSAISLYSKLEGTNWIKTLLLSTFIFLGPLFVTFSILNIVAMAHRVTATLSFRTVLALLCMWIFVGLPLLLLGGILGKFTGSRFRPPCSGTLNCPRAVPSQSWYRRLIHRCLALGGIMLFFLIDNEFYYVLLTLLSHDIYTTYLSLTKIFTALLIQTSVWALMDTFSLLSAEDHRWWWRSFIIGGSCAFYMFGYSIYSFSSIYQKLNVHSGVLQSMFFFGYMVCVCYGFFLMLGAVSFYSSLLFVCHIYGAIKAE